MERHSFDIGCPFFRAVETKGAGRRSEHRIDNRWNFVGDTLLGLEGPFTGYAYCDKPTYFVSQEESVATQGNTFGTAHPNAAGHAAYAKMLLDAINLDEQTEPYNRVTVIIDALRIGHYDYTAGGSLPVDIYIGLQQFQNDDSYLGRFLGPGENKRLVVVPRTGDWVSVPADLGTFTLDIWAPTAPPRRATVIRLSITNIPEILHTFDDGYGAGPHVLEYNQVQYGLTGVKYHIVVASLQPLFFPTLPADRP